MEEPWGTFHPGGPPQLQGGLPCQHRRMEPLKANLLNANSDLEVPVINGGTLPLSCKQQDTGAFKATNYRSCLFILSPSLFSMWVEGIYAYLTEVSMIIYFVFKAA